MPNLEGKVSIITGSSSGIGQSAAVLFAKLSSTVVITGRSAEKLAETKKRCLEHTTEDKILSVIGDLSDLKVLQQLRDETVKKFGKIDILIHNAGVGSTQDGPTAPIAVFDQLIDVNVRSVIQLTTICLPELIKTKGAIISTSSIVSSIPWTKLCYGGMTKAALDHYSRCLAVEYGPMGVRVNTVNPGFVHMDVGGVIRRRLSASSSSGSPEQKVNQFIAGISADYPLRRIGTGEDVAQAMAFLASDEAAWITGQHLHVDGGYNRTCPRHDLQMAALMQSDSDDANSAAASIV